MLARFPRQKLRWPLEGVEMVVHLELSSRDLGDKHLHLHMKSYHKEKDGQAFAKKHGYKVKNYVKTPSGTRMDIHKEATWPDEMPKEEVDARLTYTRKHLEFCIKLYEIQWRNGRYFAHEHPADASSWEETMMKQLMSRQGVQRVRVRARIKV